MSIGRNEPCPCGSGKKYKQCCLKKEKVVELGQVKRDQFFQMKHKLTERLMEEVLGSYSFSGYQSLVRKFKEQAGMRETMDEFVRYWLMFFHRHPAFDGLRGIEWYNRKKGQRDDPGVQRMAQKWESLVPRLIQHVDFNEHGVVVEDLFTNERFHMPYCETLPEPQPWGGVFCLLEEWNGGYYVNGVAAIVGPRKLKAAEKVLKSYMEKTGDSYENAAFELFPKMIGALLQEAEWRKKEESELTNTNLVYSMTDVNEVMTAVHQTGCLEIDEWDGHNGKASLVKNRYRYEDNLANGAVFLNEIEAILEIKGNQLTYQSFDQEVTEKFKRILVDIPQAVLIKEENETKKVPGKVQANSFSVVLEEGVQPIFASFAQQSLLTCDLHLPLQLFDGNSPAEMVALDKHAELELWLREIEYGSYRNTKNQTKEKWTADFNSIRKALNRPLSPFTTLQEQRESSLILLEHPGNTMYNWTQEELKLWDELDIPVHEIKSEYARDLLAFFQEKGAGKSPNTFYKYRLGVQAISYFLEEEAIDRTTGILPEQWERLIGYYYLGFNYDATANQAKGFMTVVKAFAAWLDNRDQTAYGPVVKQLVKEMETPVLQAIMILETYTPYNERRYEFSESMGEFRRIFGNGELPGQLMKGCFLVKSVTASYVNFVNVEEPAGKVYKTTVRKEILSLIQPEMVICGALSKKTKWSLYSVERVYLETSVSH